MNPLQSNPLNAAGGQLGGAGGQLAGLNINDPELQKRLADFMMQAASQEPQAQNVNFQRQQAAALRNNPLPQARSGFGVAAQALQGGMEGYLDKKALEGNQELARKRFEAWKAMQGGTPPGMQPGMGGMPVPEQDTGYEFGGQ